MQPGQLHNAESKLRDALKTFETLAAAAPGRFDHLHFVADTHRRLALVLRASGQPDAAMAEYQQAIRLHEEKQIKFAGPTFHADERAAAYLEYSLFLSHVGRDAEARALYEKGLAIQPGWPGACNHVAWLLATSLYPELRDPDRAVDLAKKAVELAPNAGGYWNTLGVAQYRAGEWQTAIESLSKSMELLAGRIESYNSFFLAMAHWQLGDKSKARSWYARAVEWMEKNQAADEECFRFRAEAAALLGVDGKKE
jgi:tetratricopeptide (TPR) repeat protein